MPKPIICSYCSAVNPAGSHLCLACGAPIELPVIPPLRVTTVADPAVIPTPTAAVSNKPRPDTTPQQITDAVDAAPLSEELKDGLKVVGATLGTFSLGGILFKTAAEAAAIAFSSLLIGYSSGTGRHIFIAILGGIIIGFAVGSVTKRSIWVMLSAPAGTILGMLVSLAVNPLMPSLPWTPILAIAGGTLFALLGSFRRRSSGVMKWYERVRPLLGLTGGFIFTLIGYAIGSLTH